MTKSEIVASDKAGGGMFVVIPSVVMRDPELSLSAKMLYGVITWKSNESACCWATNRTLGDELGLSPKRISALLSALEAQGHIELEIIRDPESNQITRRNIYPMVKSARPTLKNEDTPIPENEDTSPHLRGEPIPEKAEEKYKEEIKKEINTPLTPQRGARTERKSKYDLAEDAKPILRSYVKDDGELARLLGDFIDTRKKLRAINSTRAILIQLEALEKLSGGKRELKLELLKQSIGNSYKGIFPLKAGGRPAQAEPERLELVQGPGVYDL